MKIYEPNEFPIEIEEEELATLNKACDIIAEIIKAMEKRKCTILEGGYEECPYTFSLEMFTEMRYNLDSFCTETPHKMY